MGKGEQGYKARVAFKQTTIGFALAGSVHFFLKYLQEYDGQFEASGRGAAHFGQYMKYHLLQTGDRFAGTEFGAQPPSPLSISSEQMLQLPEFIINHGSNFAYSIPAAGFGFLVARVLRMPFLGTMLAGASVFYANYLSEFVADRVRHGSLDLVDIATGLAGGLVGIPLYRWWANRYRSDRIYSFDYDD
jgi:hypothetical protein